MEALDAIIQIVALLVRVFSMVVIVYFVINLLFMFNVISPSNDMLRTVSNSLQQLLDPILEPVRRIMPDTGTIDFSPMVVIIGGQILLILLSSMRGAF